VPKLGPISLVLANQTGCQIPDDLSDVAVNRFLPFLQQQPEELDFEPFLGFLCEFVPERLVRDAGVAAQAEAQLQGNKLVDCVGVKLFGGDLGVEWDGLGVQDVEIEVEDEFGG
jgi:hypothetical protein